MNIPAILSQESAGLAMGLTVGSLGEVKVFVPAEKVEEARKILQDMEEGKLVSNINLDPLESSEPQYKSNKFARSEILKEQDL
jgi:hypothetical protein